MLLQRFDSDIVLLFINHVVYASQILNELEVRVPFNVSFPIKSRDVVCDIQQKVRQALPADD